MSLEGATIRLLQKNGRMDTGRLIDWSAHHIDIIVLAINLMKSLVWRALCSIRENIRTGRGPC